MSLGAEQWTTAESGALQQLAACPLVETLSVAVRDAFKACVTLQARYILDTFGKFPGTVPTVFILNYVQAEHIDLDFSDRFFKPGYLRTHAEHMERWHG